MIQISISREKLKQIITDIFDFENSLKENGGEIKIDRKGYLIDIKAYDELKTKIKYNYLVKYLSNPKNFARYSCEIKTNNIKIKKWEPKKFNNSAELLEALKTNNEYIIINPLLNKSINPNYDNLNKNEGILFYTISPNNLIIALGENEKIFFKNNKMNIIAKNSFIKIYNNIDMICNNIIEYYKFEKSLTKELNEKNEKKNIKEGYLVDENWFNKWKEYTDYKNIKDHFLNKDEITVEDIDKIKIHINSNLDNNNIKLDKLETIKFNNINDLKYILQSTSLVLINIKFIETLKEYQKCGIEQEIAFLPKYREIIFLSKDNKNKNIVNNFKIYSYNNIISLKVNYCFNLVNNLVKIYISQEKIKAKLKNKKSGKIIQNNSQLIDKNWIKNFKKYYNYDILIDSIKNLKINDLENNEDEKKIFIDKYYLLQEIKDIYFDSICNKISFNEFINKNKYNINGLENKRKDYKNKTLQYLDNFEIIDSEIKLNCYSENIIAKDAIYYIDNNKLLIQYEINNNNINYIIGYINKENSFISEYLIEYFNIFNINLQDIIFNLGINYFINKINEKNENGYYNISETIGYCYELQPNKINKQLSNYLKEEIKILIQLFLFNTELKNKLIKSKNNNKYIISDKCYLINGQWLSKYKYYYLYDKLFEYLNQNKNIQNLIISKIDKGNLYNENNCNYIFNNIEKNTKLIELYYQKEIKDHSKLFELEENFMEVDKKYIVKGKEVIFYYNDFIVVNKEIYYKLIIDKYKNVKNCHTERDYIINSGKILIKIDTDSMYQIMIGELTNIDKINNINDEYEINQILFINFIDEYEVNVNYKNFLNTNFDNYLPFIKYNNYKIYNENLSKELGEGYPLMHNNGIKINNYITRENPNEIIKHEPNLDILYTIEHNNSFYYLQEKNNSPSNKELDEAKQLIEMQNEKIQYLENQLQISYDDNSKIKETLYDKIFEKEEEIKQLKLKLENMNKKEVIPVEDMVCVYFSSLDQTVNFAIPCSKKDIFAKVEEKLYQEFSNLRDTNNYFLFDGKQILRFKTIEENKISSGKPVSLIKNDNYAI